jgi:hypothetical protein
MTIPLDNLYHYIDGLFDEPVCTYLFYPHGSKNISNLVGLHSIVDKENVIRPQVVCHDQEPLNFDFYKNHTFENVEYTYNLVNGKVSKDFLRDSNLSLATHAWNNWYNKTVLVHSEKNSEDLAQYEAREFVGAYYWAHAVIAKDWYRFAKNDVRLSSHCMPDIDFLIYSRDWTGSREYRLKFQELLFESCLHSKSLTSIKKVSDSGVAAKDYVFLNTNLKPKSFDFLNSLKENTCGADSSAIYSPDDISRCKISVVLETVVDGNKIHLTEKIIRSLACGHPFIVAAGPGSLEYLRSYGFKTFSPLIDEDYDQETNTVIRLQKIISAMKKFNDLSTNRKSCVYREIKKIANYNRQWFFSKEFDDIVHGELVTNIQSAMKKITLKSF